MLRELAFIIIRVLALYVFIQGLGQLINIIQLALPYYWDEAARITNFPSLLFLSSLSGILFLLFGTVLWLKAGKFSQMLIKDKEQGIVKLEMNYKELYILGLSLTGIVVFIHSFPRLLVGIGQLIWYYSVRDFGYINPFEKDIWFELSANVLKVLLSLALIFGTNGIHGLLSKARNLGLAKNDGGDA